MSIGQQYDELELLQLRVVNRELRAKLLRMQDDARRSQKAAVRRKRQLRSLRQRIDAASRCGDCRGLLPDAHSQGYCSSGATTRATSDG